jgi:hypothetical protein
MEEGMSVLAAVAQRTAHFDLNLPFVVNRLPLWFLVFALFLPRLAMVVAWFLGALTSFHLQGIIPPIFWLFLPRILVLYLIYMDQGLTLWFVLHLVVAIVVWGGSSHQMQRRRRSDY